MSLSKLSRQTLAEQAVASLTAYIYEQELKPGDVLPSETKLAELLGVSRPVVREALKIMAGQHIVEIENGVGAVVQPLDSRPLDLYFHHALKLETHSLVELAEIREALEVKSAALAAIHRAEGDLQQLHETIANMRNSLTDFETYAHHDVAFHLHIARASGNGILYNLIEAIRDAIQHSVLVGLQQRSTFQALEQAHKYHESILSAIEAEDSIEAAHAMREHFENAISVIATRSEKD